MLLSTLIVSELTIAEGPAPEDAVTFEDVAFTVERAAGEVCDRCRRIDPTTAERHYHATICDHCASIVEENFAEQPQKDLKLNKAIKRSSIKELLFNG